MSELLRSDAPSIGDIQKATAVHDYNIPGHHTAMGLSSEHLGPYELEASPAQLSIVYRISQLQDQDALTSLTAELERIKIDLRRAMRDINDLYSTVEGTHSEYIREHSHRRGHARGSSQPAGDDALSSVPDYVREFLEEEGYGLPPNRDPFDPSDNQSNTKRCVVGRGILRPTARFYRECLCDKHGSVTLFRENMSIYPGREDAIHAYKCS
jgi:hypothetical protein